MKYTLVPIGEKCPCTGCQREYRLVEDTDGYDLIQFKRGNQVNRLLSWTQVSSTSVAPQVCLS